MGGSDTTGTYGAEQGGAQSGNAKNAGAEKDSAPSWLLGPRAAFDVETTGRDPHQARLVTASVVLLDASGEVTRSRDWLVDPGVEIPEQASEIHGITTEQARAEGQPIEEAVRHIVESLSWLFGRGIPVVAFNAPYDFTVMAAECARFQVEPTAPLPVIDPFVLDKQVDRFRPGKRTLSATCAEYHVSLEQAHTSAADALAAVRLAEALVGRYPELGVPAAELHRAQIGWAREQAESFQAYLRGKGQSDAVIDGTWPVA